MRRLLRKPVTWVAMAVVVAGLVVGLALFEPWRAFTSSRLDEAVPVAAPIQTEPTSTGATTPTITEPTTTDPTTTEPTTTEPTTTTPPEPAVLAEGAFVSQEHDTAGTARVLELPDGARILRLENFHTSDGPDVHVWLSAATAGGEWGKFDDGRFVALGLIKATDGNHNYEIPPDADISGLKSVVIWCDRFNVAFGSAPLAL